MTTPEERKNLIELVNYNIGLVLSKTAEEFIREIDLGKVLSFKPAELIFVKIQELVTSLKNSDFNKIPYRKLESINSELGEMISLIGNILDMVF